MLPSQWLLERTVLITGAGGSIGIETATRLLQEGANLSLIKVCSSVLKRAASKLYKYVYISGDSTDSRVLLSVGDVISESDVERYTTKTVEKFGRLDCAFLNAGISYTSTGIFNIKEESCERVMKVNVKNQIRELPPNRYARGRLIIYIAFLGLKHSAKATRDLGSGRSIIVISSITGLQGVSGLIPYSGSKSALPRSGTYGRIGIGTIGHPCQYQTPQ